MRFLRENLAVCGFADITRQEQFSEHGFTCQLQLVEGHDAWLQHALDVLCLPFLDGLPIPPERFKQCMEWLQQRWSNGGHILISCAAGESRSVSIAIALLALSENASFLTVATEVISKIPRAYPHPVTLASAAALAGFPAFSAEDLSEAFRHSYPQPQFPWPDDLIRGAIEQWDSYLDEGRS